MMCKEKILSEAGRWHPCCHFAPVVSATPFLQLANQDIPAPVRAEGENFRLWPFTSFAAVRHSRRNTRSRQRAGTPQITHFGPHRRLKQRHENSLPHRPDHRLGEYLGLGAAAEVGGAAPRIQHRGIGGCLDACGRMEELAKLMPLAK